jgi:hypothetical protein
MILKHDKNMHSHLAWIQQKCQGSPHDHHDIWLEMGGHHWQGHYSTPMLYGVATVHQMEFGIVLTQTITTKVHGTIGDSSALSSQTEQNQLISFHAEFCSFM